MKLIDYDKWGEIIDSLKRHKLRTFLTMFAVWWGIFMLVLLLGAGSGLQNGVEFNFRDDAINSIWVYPGKTSEPYKGLPAGRWINFDNSDYTATTTGIDGVEYATGRLYMSGEYFVTYQNKAFSFDIRSVNPGHQMIENTEILRGRYINEKDIEEYRKVAVIGTKVSEAFFEKDENPIGKELTIKGTTYMVVGEFTDSGGDNELRKIYLPITTVQKVVTGRDRIDQMMFTIGDAGLEESQRIENNIRSEMASRKQFSVNDENAIWIRNNVENFQEFQMVFGFINAFIWFVGIGSIIAGVIGVSNIMLIVVKERTREIGIRKALGATPPSIINMIITESMVLTGFAGYLGLITGVVVLYLVNWFLVSNSMESEFFRNPGVNFWVVFSALILLVICGVVAGLIPALQAVKINPVQAMKE
ncbi:MAG: ABC transporter permease [Saprospiraceae bacterium]